MLVLVNDGAGAGVDIEGGWGACGVVYNNVVSGGYRVDADVEDCIVCD